MATLFIRFKPEFVRKNQSSPTWGGKLVCEPDPVKPVRKVPIIPIPMSYFEGDVIVRSLADGALYRIDQRRQYDFEAYRALQVMGFIPIQVV